MRKIFFQVSDHPPQVSLLNFPQKMIDAEIFADEQFALHRRQFA